jgi:hypothetical protein
MARPAIAQYYSFKSYAQANELKNVAVTTIAKDRMGYIWAGTQSGLYRYDGFRFMPVGGKGDLPSFDVLMCHPNAQEVVRDCPARRCRAPIIPLPPQCTSTPAALAEDFGSGAFIRTEDHATCGAVGRPSRARAGAACAIETAAATTARCAPTDLFMWPRHLRYGPR